MIDTKSMSVGGSSQQNGFNLQKFIVSSSIVMSVFSEGNCIDICISKKWVIDSQFFSLQQCVEN